MPGRFFERSVGKILHQVAQKSIAPAREKRG
jgi:hypothetical protein